MLLPIVLAALVAVPLLLPTAAPAQNAAGDTQLQMEAKRKRLMVRPEPAVDAGVRDAEQAANEAAVAEYARQANAPVRQRPQLDYDVTSALTSRNAQRGLRR